MVFKSPFFIVAVCSVLLFSCKEKDKKVTEPQKTLSEEMSLRDAVNKYPDSLSLRQSLIQYYSDSGNYKKAIAVADEALARDTANIDLWDTKAQLYYQDGDTLSAIKSYEQALRIYPMPDYMVSVGNLYAQTKNPKAIPMADELLKERDPKVQIEGHFIKGLYYEFTGEKAKAIGFFDKCIQMDYTYMVGYREKAICLYDLGKYNEALEVLTKAVTVQNSYDEGYYWMGRCFEKLHKQDLAIENYQTALMYDKDFVEAREALNRLQGK
jgi:tetratricopeptide (TPR) repeat protein